MKFISSNLPFEERHCLINNPNLLKPLLLLYPFAATPVNMVITSMIENFQNSKLWVEGVLKNIEEVAAISETEILLTENVSDAEIL